MVSKERGLHIKKVLCAIIALALIFATSAATSASDNEMPLLSELSDEECLAFLDENGVEIPTLYENEQACVPFVRTVFEQIESNPDATVVYRYPSLMQFANDITKAASEYYGVAGIMTYNTSNDSSIVEDSVVYGNWSSTYANYNCYGYAIGKHALLNPGFSTWVSDGNALGTYYYNDYANMYTISNWVKADLEYYGYTVNTVSTAMPDTQVSHHTHLICVRKDLQRMPYVDENGEIIYLHDFHFMRLDMDGSWYHKPSVTSPLRYKYTPSNTRAWINEGYDGTQYFHHEDYTYDSEIYFIEYTTPHKWEYVYCGTNNGTHQHINTCTICWQTSGTAIACTYRTGSDVCKICGHNKNAAITSLRLPEDTYTYLNE